MARILVLFLALMVASACSMPTPVLVYDTPDYCCGSDNAASSAGDPAE